MDDEAVKLSVGAISGTSMDAIDVAILHTDGQEHIEFIGSTATNYPEALRCQLLELAARGEQSLGQITPEIEVAVAQAFAVAINDCLEASDIASEDVDLIGCHGQTIWHDPANKVTKQVCDCTWLANEFNVAVVGDFRQQDVASGGHGAPLAPLYHAALVREQELPVVVLNLGGVGNLTYVDGEEILAFDTGPANALLDDFVKARTGQDFDANGQLAASGTVVAEIVSDFCGEKFFAQPPPKSLDRFAFHHYLECVEQLTDADGAATLLALTLASLDKAQELLPNTAKAWLVTGGGSHNQTLMAKLAATLGNVKPIETIGARSDSLEAEAFAYLAVRSMAGLPLSLPSTTGVAKAMPGGQIYPLPSS